MEKDYCEWCDPFNPKNKNFQCDDADASVFITKNRKLKLSTLWGKGMRVYECSIAIEFCPKCGRKLND